MTRQVYKTIEHTCRQSSSFEFDSLPTVKAARRWGRGVGGWGLLRIGVPKLELGNEPIFLRFRTRMVVPASCDAPGHTRGSLAATKASQLRTTAVCPNYRLIQGRLAGYFEEAHQFMDSSQEFFLLKHGDGDIFGPVPLPQLVGWAENAQISPLDKISTDQQNWLKAPMLADLKMDFLIALSDETWYGPTTLGALREFFVNHEIDDDTPILNTCDGATFRLGDIATVDPDLAVQEDITPTGSGITQTMQETIHDLENTVAEQRRYINRLEEAYAALEAELASVSKKSV